MNARLSTRLARAASVHSKRSQRDVTEKAISHIQWLWNIAGCRHELAGTTPADQIPMDADDEALKQLVATARLCGC